MFTTADAAGKVVVMGGVGGCGDDGDVISTLGGFVEPVLLLLAVAVLPLLFLFKFIFKESEVLLLVTIRVLFSFPFNDPNLFSDRSLCA